LRVTSVCICCGKEFMRTKQGTLQASFLVVSKRTPAPFAGRCHHLEERQCSGARHRRLIAPALTRYARWFGKPGRRLWPPLRSTRRSACHREQRPTRPSSLQKRHGHLDQLCCQSVRRGMTRSSAVWPAAGTLLASCPHSQTCSGPSRRRPARSNLHLDRTPRPKTETALW
jgi:hypothetical protein